MNARGMLAAAVVLVCGAGASLAVFMITVDADRARTAAEFQQLAEARFGAIEQHLHNAEQAVTSTAAFVENTGTFQPGQFSMFVRAVSRGNPAIEAVQWAPKVGENERQDFEQQTGRPIRQFSNDDLAAGGAVAGLETRRVVYFPVLLSHPGAVGIARPGMDLLSNPVLAPALERARDEATIQASKPLAQRQEADSAASVLLIHAVYRGPVRTRPERRQSIIGVVVAPVDFKSILDAARFSLRQSSSPISTTLYLAEARQDAPEYRSSRYAGSQLRHERSLNFGNRQWSVLSMPDEPGTTATISSRATSAALAGLLTTCFALAYVISTATRSQTISKMAENLARDLQRSQHYSDAILRTGPSGMLLLNRNSEITLANQAAGEMFGYPQGELVGKQISALIPDLNIDQAASGTIKKLGKDSNGFPLDLQCTITDYRTTDEAFVVLVVDDVTEQNVVQSSMRDQRNLMQTIVETMKEGLVLVDHQRRPQIVNHAARNLLDPSYQLPRPSDEPNVQGFLDAASLLPLPARELPLNRALAGEKIELENVMLRNRLHPEGIQLEITASPIRRGKHTGALMVMSDVTDRMRAQEQLRNYAGKLEASNQELEQFARAASHDLQEPLRKVERFGSLLRDINATVLDAQSLDYLDRMISAADRMSSMIDSLLALARISSENRGYAQCDLNLVAGRALDNLQVRIGDTRARIQIDELPTIDADPIQIEQLFTNIIGNAMKYVTPGDTPVVHVSSRRSADGRNCLLVFRDEGIGFPADKAELLFSVFTRLVRREQYAGSGVGLSICRRIAERHGGHIWAESAPGKGATFFVSLPLHQPDATVAPAHTEHPA